MRRLAFIGAIALLVFAEAETASAQSLAVVLDVQRECATPEDETSLITELRFRVPEATVMLGNTSAVEANWRVRWARDTGGDCRIEVAGADEEPQSLMMPDESEAADIELAASQVAWILTMHRSEPPAPEVSTEETVAVEVASPEQDDETPVDPEPAEPETGQTPPNNESEAQPEEPETPAETEEPTEAEQPGEGDERREPKPEEEGPRPSDQEDEAKTYEVVGGSYSIIPGRSFPDHGARRVVPNFSLGLIGNEHWGLEGFEFGLIYNRKTAFMDGMQIALVYNHVGNRVGGIQFALGANLGDGLVSGIQTALLYNSASKRLEGLQVAMGMNSAGEVAGIQTAFGGNSSDGLDGAQVAFGFNVADDVDGVQASLVNIADRVDGVQVGLVNISETADVPVGLVNIMTDEPLRFVGHTSFSGFSTVGLLHGGRTLRYLYLAGFKAIGDKQVYGAGVGLSLNMSFGRFFADPEWIAMQVSEESVKRLSFMSMLRLSLGWRFAERFAIFLAPSATLLSTGSSDGLGLVPGFSEPTSEGGSEGTPSIWVYPEVHLGFRF